MNKLLKGYVFRMYLNKKQEILINKTIGCSRFVYNYALDKKKKEYEENHKTLSAYDLIKLIPSLCNDYMWLKEVDSCSLRNSIFNLDNVYQRFYKGKGFPKFKSKGVHDRDLNASVNISPKGLKIYMKGLHQ